jgi:hypothetical protein
MSNPTWESTQPIGSTAAPQSTGAVPTWESTVDPSQFETPTQLAKTALEQAASGATLGLSKVFETKMLGVKPEDIAMREAINPGTAVTSNVAGTIAGLFGPEEALLPVKGVQLAGRAIEAGLGAGKLAKIAAPAVEGALFGGIQQATDDWSQNKALDAEKIAASAGIGALLGGGIAGGVEALKMLPKGMSTTVQKLKELAGKPQALEPGEIPSWSEAFKAGLNLQEENPKTYVKNLTNTLNDLYTQSKQASQEMYEKAGEFHLGNALQGVTKEEADLGAKNTIDKIKGMFLKPYEVPGPMPEPSKLILPGEYQQEMIPETITKYKSLLRGSSTKVINEQLDKLEGSIAKASTSKEVFDSLKKFATDFDRNIKFDKLPTVNQQAERDILDNIRGAIRGDLKNPDIWKEAAPVYNELSQNYAEFKATMKQFDKEFTVPFTLPSGAKVRRIAPGKVNTFFNQMNDPRMALRNEALDGFINSAMKNAQYATNFEGYQKEMNDIVDKMLKTQSELKLNTQQAQMMDVLKNAKKGTHEGLSPFLLFEMARSIPGLDHFAAPLMMLMRYSNPGGGYRAGSDLYHTLNAVNSLSNHVTKATDMIDKGVRAVFHGR